MGFYFFSYFANLKYMPVERSAGIIVFRNTPKGRRFLVIRSHRKKPQIGKKKFSKEHWDFPKGRLEKREKGIEAARREAKEEVGIKKIELLPDFKETVQYFTWREGRPILKFVAMFLGRTQTFKVKLSWEHDKYGWLAYKDASKMITLPPMKKALEKAERFLKGMANRV